jgi:hypothetical protein
MATPSRTAWVHPRTNRELNDLFDLCTKSSRHLNPSEKPGSPGIARYCVAWDRLGSTPLNDIRIKRLFFFLGQPRESISEQKLIFPVSRCFIYLHHTFNVLQKTEGAPPAGYHQNAGHFLRMLLGLYFLILVQPLTAAGSTSD